MSRAAIGVTGVSARAMVDALASAGVSALADPTQIAIVINGQAICSGEVDEIQFVDGGVLFWIKPPKAPRPPPIRVNIK